MSRILRALSLWLPVVAWAALIFVLSSIPSLNSGLGVWDLVLRKLAHTAEYAVLAALLLRALARPWLAFLVAVAYAASDEFHQHFVRGRAGTPRDVAIDAVGAFIGVALFSYGRRLMGKRADSKTS
jgi:VanZ family protein